MGATSSIYQVKTTFRSKLDEREGDLMLRSHQRITKANDNDAINIFIQTHLRRLFTTKSIIISEK